jgi:hypothetical protein
LSSRELSISLLPNDRQRLDFRVQAANLDENRGPLGGGAAPQGHDDRAAMRCTDGREEFGSGSSGEPPSAIGWKFDDDAR